MKPISTFCVIPDLPDQLAPLWDLGHNLWWSWCQESVVVFYRMDPEAWIASGRNPLRFLSALGPEQLAKLSSDTELTDRIEGVVSRFEEYRKRRSWFEQSYPASPRSIAYFSLEFGLAESPGPRSTSSSNSSTTTFSPSASPAVLPPTRGRTLSSTTWTGWKRC